MSAWRRRPDLLFPIVIARRDDFPRTRTWERGRGVGEVGRQEEKQRSRPRSFFKASPSLQHLSLSPKSLFLGSGRARDEITPSHSAAVEQPQLLHAHDACRADDEVIDERNAEHVAGTCQFSGDSHVLGAGSGIA